MQKFEIIPNHTDLYLDKLDNYPQKTGSQACRELLAIIQQQNNLTAPLQIDNFPYHFSTQQQTYFVCFSHSQQQIAILLSKSAKIGVDIEDKLIKDNVVQRFFAKNEQQWINNLTKPQQSLAKKMLWTLKESIVKSLANPQSILITTLKQDLITQYHQENLNKLILPTIEPNQLNHIYQSTTYLGFLPKFSCGLLINLDDNDKMLNN